uniref:Folliculin-interacting protein 2 n=1 Tax=Diabrotica virgifera virgifera TaxID=50390 RepID=A0A6P7F796_DIAVI
MANKNNFLKSKKKNDCFYGNEQYWENLNLYSSNRIRILLFKECRLRDRELIFDSYRETKDQNGPTKEEKNKPEEFSHLTEMIFGSTAMKYHDTYFKIHDVSFPDRLIFTQVFSTPLVKKLSNSKSSLNNSNIDFSNNSFTESCNSFANSGSEPSFGSNSDSFSLIRNVNWISPNSTSTTIDSGFSESSFSRNSSFTQYSGGFSTRRSSTSCTSLDTFGSFLSEADSARNFRMNVSYSKLGLALIVPKPIVEYNEENIYLQHIPLIESILWRVRQYVEIALNSPRLFLSTMLEISLLSAKWLSHELNFWSKPGNEPQSKFHLNFAISLRNSLNKLTFPSNIFRSNVREERFENFCQVLEKLETKETKFFMSTLLTAILTHHTGWIAACHPLEGISLDDSYHAIWNQLTNLFGATGYLTKTSKTVIYGLKNDDLIKKVLDFLLYFLRYFKVQRRYVERSNVEEENKIVNDILNSINCNNVEDEIVSKPKRSGLSRTKSSSFNLSTLTNFHEEDEEGITNETNNNYIQKPHLQNNQIEINNRNDECGLKRSGLSKSKACGNDLCKLSALAEETSLEFGDETEENHVLFILGDNEKLEDLKKTNEVRKTERKLSSNTLDISEPENADKLNVIKFPLPEEKPIGDLIEVLPTSFLPDHNALDELVPDKIVQGLNVPKAKWERILTNDLLRKKSCLFTDRIEENVAIVADVDSWDVQVLSSVKKRMAKREMGGDVDASPIVASMLDTVLQMWKQNMSKEQCSTFLEQKLTEICLKANALCQFLLTTDFCTMDTLVKTLKINLVDVPLLMAVGSHINPKVLQKYGLSYQ